MENISKLGQSSRNMKYSPKLIIVLIVVIVLGLGAGGYFVYQNYIVKSQNSPEAAEREAKNLATEIGKFMVLPADEIPTIATVSDIEKLKNQPFFQNAKNGDKVLIYSKAKKAILYDPKARKIIDVGPLNIATQATQQQAKIALRNGTTIDGLAARVEGEILKAFPGTLIVSKEQAKSQTYDKTAVIALNEQSKVAAEELAKMMKVSVTNTVPSGEDTPKDIDILVILGRDRGNQPESKPVSPTQSPSPAPTKQ